MKRISATEVHELGAMAFGLDASSVNLETVECIAASLRRAAGFLCPCSSTMLVDAVLTPLALLVEVADVLKEVIDNTLEAMVAYGDLVESHVVERPEAERKTILLYATPPSFVPRDDGSAFLLGIIPDQHSPVPEELSRSIEYINHTRRIPPISDGDLKSYLAELGLFDLSMDQWIKAPPSASAEEYIRRFDDQLDRAGPSGEVPGIRILEPSANVRYYKGRWTEPRKHTGKFLGRRPQPYGADLWCYVTLDNGIARKLIDLPMFEMGWRACDEAWRLQAAIDAQLGHPQEYQIRAGPTKEVSVLDLYSPIPSWAQRRWDCVGRPAPNVKCFKSYAFSSATLDQELQFAAEKLWLFKSP